MRRIYVLGPNGMLGQMALRYFGQRPGNEVMPLRTRFELGNLINYFHLHDDEPPAVFINGIGAIPQRVGSAADYILPNVLLPLELARTLADRHLLVHPSTDCVFRGDLGLPYPSSTPPDAVDAYGWSKLQAERVLSARPNTLIIRTSIIGPSVGPASGLLQWFLSQPQGARLSGYTNHFWNGLTTLQWCTEVERLLGEFDGSTSRLIQFASPDALSKHDMLLMFKDIFRQDISITAVEHAQRVDRRLHADIDVPSLVRQLEQLRDWMETA